MTNITADDLVRREVHYCVSSLVSTLAGGYGAVTHPHYNGDLPELTEQAFELASPVDDWEEAALQAGWTRRALDGHWTNPSFPGAVASKPENIAEDWQSDLEPYRREVFEHWIVSDWLADRLAEKGEKVDKDFAGLTVWARTTTGQGIAADSVIQAIVDDLNKGA